MTSKLADIQQKLKAPKGRKNSFGGYNYRNCEDILDALKPLLQEDDLFYLTDEIVLIGDRFYIKATATFNDVSVSAFARESLLKKGMDEAQITGSASSYARKYALNGLFAIDDAEDIDSNSYTEKTKAVENKKVSLPTEPKKPLISYASLYDEKLAKLKNIRNIGELSKARPKIEDYITNLKKESIELGLAFQKEFDKVKLDINGATDEELEDDIINLTNGEIR